MEGGIKVGALIDSATPAHWVETILRDIQQHPKMGLCVAIEEPQGQPRVDTETTVARLAHWLLHTVVDTPQFSHNPWEPVALPDEISRDSLQSNPELFEQCDVIICLTRAHPSHTLSQAAIPVWSAAQPLLDLGIQRSLIKRSPFAWLHLWELQCQEGSSTQLNERIASHSLPCQTYSISDLQRLSYSALPSVFMSRLGWLVSSETFKLDPLDIQQVNQGVFEVDAQLAQEDADYLRGIEENNGKQFNNVFAPLLQSVMLLKKKTVERIHHKLFTEHWQIAVVKSSDGTTQSMTDVATIPIQDFKNIAETTDVMWADPHLIEHQTGLYMFFEQMHEHNNNAHIAYAKLDDHGQMINNGIALTAAHHLSFPYVFEHAGGCYMIPETASLNCVNLYKATKFPDQWEHHATLIENINAADSVLIQHNGLWWMFTSCQSHRSVDERDELQIYYAEDIEGPWQAHAANPVITGIDRSRMAGPIVSEDGQLYRVSQYGAWRYGYGINTSRIDELTPTSYRETAVLRKIPDKKSQWVGCHSLCQLGDLTVIDRVRHSRH